MPMLFCEPCETATMVEGLDQRACPTCGATRFLHNLSFTGEMSLEKFQRTHEVRDGQWVAKRVPKAH